MTPPRRKLTMQLTPLLDLLLIVIFAQYMEMRESAGAATENVSVLQQDLQSSQAESARLHAKLTEAAQQLEASTQTVTATQALLKRHQSDWALQEDRLLRAERRQQLLGRLMVELFQIPQEEVAAILDPDRIPPLADSTQDSAALQKKFRQMATASPQEMIRHLVTFEEVRKHCDIWELQLRSESRELTIRSGSEQRTLVLPLQDAEDFAALDGAAFEKEFYTQLKSLPQPKGLVLITLTYDFAVRENVLGPARTAIDYVIDRLRVESAGRSQFEYADLGILRVK